MLRQTMLAGNATFSWRASVGTALVDHGFWRSQLVVAFML
jgi:hypothetical protein